MSTGFLYRLITVLLLASLLMAPTPAGAASSRAPACTTPVTVTDPADTGTNTLRWAIETEVCDGGTINFNLAAPVSLSSQVVIAKNLTIDGSGTPGVQVSAAQSRIFTVNGGTTVTLRGISLSGGMETNGGAIWNAGNLTLDQASLVGAFASSTGGAIYNIGALTITNSALSNNSANQNGGAIFNLGELSITGSQFAGNQAGGQWYGAGGAISNGFGGGARPAGPDQTAAAPDFPFPAIYDLVIQNSRIFDNSASGLGGGVYNAEGFTAVITNTGIISNSADGGGGLYNSGYGGVVEVYDSSLYGNQAAFEGGGIGQGYGGNLAVVRSDIVSNTLTNNTASFAARGAGVSNSSGNRLVLANVTLANNRILGTFQVDQSYGGAALYHFGWQDGPMGLAWLINTSVSGNQVNDSGKQAASGLWIDGGPLTVTNSIIAGNGSSGLGNFLVNSDPESEALLDSGGGNLTNSNDGLLDQPSDQENVDPGLATLWQFAAERWIAPLKPASPAINAALAAPCSEWPVSSLDQRGRPRPVGAGCDSGAYEASGYTLSIVGGDEQSTPVNTSFANPLVVQVASNVPGEPLDGLTVGFTQPASGASAVLAGSPLPVTATLDGSGQASLNAAANSLIGSYPVTATLQGTALAPAPVYFDLTNLPSGADLAAQVSVRWDPVLIGATNYLTLTVSNPGEYLAPAAVVTNSLPAGTTLMTVSDPACSMNGQDLVCALGDLAVGASRTITFRIRLTAAIPDNTLLANQAVVASALSDPNPANNTATAEFLGVIELLVYQLDGTPGAEWGADGHMATPACGSPFLGEFSNQTVTLTVTNLQEHYYARSVFDVYILRSWDGNQVDNQLPPNLRGLSPDEVVGPDHWGYTFAGQPVMEATFSNWTYYQYNQTFPGPAGSSFPATTGAKSVNTLCYTFKGYAMDAVYGMGSYAPQDAETLHMTFTGAGLQEIEDESWGLGGLAVYIRALPLRTLYLPITR